MFKDNLAATSVILKLFTSDTVYYSRNYSGYQKVNKLNKHKGMHFVQNILYLREIHFLFSHIVLNFFLRFLKEPSATFRSHVSKNKV